MTTLFDALGGNAAVDAAVDRFYDKVLADANLVRFFAETDMGRQRAHQKAFLTVAFGGPNHYSGRDMRSGHAQAVAAGLNDSHFDAVVEHLAATLAEMDVAPALIAQVAAVAESVRDEILGR